MHVSVPCIPLYGMSVIFLPYWIIRHFTCIKDTSEFFSYHKYMCFNLQWLKWELHLWYCFLGFFLQITMSGSGVQPPLTTHILDTARGKPANSVPMILSIREQNGEWKQLHTGYCTTHKIIEIFFSFTCIFLFFSPQFVGIFS